MKVELIDYDSMHKIIKAARTSHGSESDNMGPEDKKLIKKLLEWGHESVLEHCLYTFKIEGVSRALLQELVRHRIASYTVRSTRFTLDSLVEDDRIPESSSLDDFKDIVEEYCVVPDLKEHHLKEYYRETAENLKNIYRFIRDYGIENDRAKYLLPESFRTELIMSINVRSFRNFLKLRTSQAALWEIRKLACKIYRKLPEDHLILYQDMDINC